MELPAINIPQISLPFDIPVHLHPAVVHFAIAIPVVILLLELYNIFTKRRSIGAFSFLLLLITIGILIVVYFTGLTDGKEAYDLLTPEGQAELKEHKLLGVYVIFVAVAVLFFKLLAMTGKGFFRFIYFIFLIGLIALTLKQGKDGGELVYEHGANNERVEVLQEELSDLKEELESLQEDQKEASVPQKAPETKTEEAPATLTTSEPVEPSKPTVTEAEVSDEKLDNAISEMKASETDANGTL